jgi:hypothetical protein
MSAPNAASVTCESINDNFQRETGRIALGTHRLGLYKDPYLRFVNQSAFPDHMGAIITNTIAQRSLATGSGWSDIGITGGVEVCSETQSSVTNSCLAPVKKVGYAFDQKTFKLRHQAVESDWICLEDVRTSAFPIDDVNNYIKILADNINVEWIKRYDNDYLENATKLSVEAGLDQTTTGITFDSDGLAKISGLTAPTSVLTTGVLRAVYDTLYTDNAGDDGDAVTDDGSPVFNIFSERATVEQLVKINEDILQDIRCSDRVNDLLGPNGNMLLPKKSYAGYVFHSRPFPKRFNDGAGADAGKLVEVPPYITASATKGTKAIVNPAYKNAKYTSTVIFHPKAMEWLVPNPNLKVGKLVYDAQNYRGDFRWINEYDKQCNPDKNSGYWRAKMACAVKQIFPQWGYYIIHLRCSLAGDLVPCASGSGYGYLVP